MRTTIRINDELLRKAKKRAVETDRTLTQVVGVSDMVLSSVVRITTHPRVFVIPSTMEEVFGFTDHLDARDNWT